MPWVTDQNGNQVWQGDPTAPVTAPLSNPGSTQQPINYPPPVTVAPSAAAAPAAPAAAPATPAPASTAPAPATTTPAPGATSIGPPQGQGGQYTVDQILAPFDTEFTAANQAVLDLNTQINGRHNATDGNGNPLPDVQGDSEKLQGLLDQGYGANTADVQAAQSKYQSDLQAYSAAQQRVAVANNNRATALDKALQANQITPSQVELATAQAKESTARADQITKASQIAADLAPSQQNLIVAPGAQASARAVLDQANAAKTTATTPADIALATSKANQAQANADATTAMVDANKAKVEADTTLTQHQVGLTDNESDYYKALGTEATARAGYETAQADYQKALIPGAPGLQAAQTQQAAGAGAQAQATAQATLEGITQKQQGPLYGLQSQIPLLQSVVQSVFHNPANVGKSTDELNNMADDLLKQYTIATVGGTTVGSAAAAAASAQQNNYATLMGGTNALQNAMASRANAYAGAEGNVLGTLAQMNAWAPKGSTEGAAAFRQIMDDMSQRLASPQFAPVQLPQAPALPPFLQAFAAGHQAGQAQANAQNQGQGQSPTINVNVNGQPAGGTGPGGVAMNPDGTVKTLAQLGSTGPWANLPLQNLSTPGPTAPGFTTPPPIGAPPALGANTQQAFNSGLQNSGYNPNAIPNFAQGYMAFANPLNMVGGLGLRQPAGVA